MIDIDAIKSKVETTEYIVRDELTVCILKYENGFYATGDSAPVDPAEYDKELGEKYAYNKALDKIVHGVAFGEKKVA